VDGADRHPSVTDAAAHKTFGGEQEKHDDGEDQRVLGLGTGKRRPGRNPRPTRRAARRAVSHSERRLSDPSRLLSLRAASGFSCPTAIYARTEKQ
jgi:hypothetical protein